jgi:uncharacterized radical SAM protein YgiQ
MLKSHFPDVPVVVGGIEASMRRLAHYDYWQDRCLPSILADSGADWLVYGCGEKPIVALAEAFRAGAPAAELAAIPQTAYLSATAVVPQAGDRQLFSYEECLRDKKKQAENFRFIEEESNRLQAGRLIQATGKRWVVVNPPYPPLSTAELDACYDLPYTRMPHPKYAGKRIPAYEMIRHSVTIHRGCFGGCAFCTISAHQGKFVVSRSSESVLREVRAVTQMPDFKGYLSDLGGPSANMYGMSGADRALCEQCRRASCIFPGVCGNLGADHGPLLALYRAVDRVPGVKKSFVASGVRYDLLMEAYRVSEWNRTAEEYLRELILHHVSGRLKVAPEHTEREVLRCIRKPDFAVFRRFKKRFDRINREHRLKQQLVPYFISSHPACTEVDMVELALVAREMGLRPEQIQDFTPTPMTLATEMFYTGYHPYTLRPVYTAKTPEEKLNQRQYFFWYDRAYRERIIRALHRLRRSELIRLLYDKEQRRN